MDINGIIAELDREIAKLQQVRAILAQSEEHVRPAAVTKIAKKRGITPEGRKSIAAAMRKRWAARRKASEPKAPKKLAAKKS